VFEGALKPVEDDSLVDLEVAPRAVEKGLLLVGVNLRRLSVVGVVRASRRDVGVFPDGCCGIPEGPDSVVELPGLTDAFFFLSLLSSLGKDAFEALEQVKGLILVAVLDGLLEYVEGCAHVLRVHDVPEGGRLGR